MSNLTLLVPDDVQKTWKNYTRIHGIYALTFEANEIEEFWDNTCYVKNVYSASGSEDIIQIRLSMKKLFMSMLTNNTIIDQKSIRIVGRFVKIGKSVLFEPLEGKF